MRKALFASFGGVAAALLGSLCCAGPLVFVALGVGAGLAGTLDPLRPVFGVLVVALLGAGFYTVYGARPRPLEAPGASEDGCAAGESCAVPRSRTRDKAILWTAAVLALVLWTFPTWSRLFV
jgi:mercuric ion transport protein